MSFLFPSKGAASSDVSKIGGIIYYPSFLAVPTTDVIGIKGKGMGTGEGVPLSSPLRRL